MEARDIQTDIRKADDTSIKMVNATLDTINILLVYLLAFILARRNP